MTIGLQGLARRVARSALIGAGAATCALVAAAGTAQAASDPYDALSITSTIENKYSYTVGAGSLITVDPSPANAHLRVGANDGGFLSEVGIDLTTSLSGDSFSFLHNAYCVGRCGIEIQTIVDFHLANTGDSTLNLRWDSLITPGHMGQIGSNGSALFHLVVVEGNLTTSTSGAQIQFRGETHGWYDQIDTGAGFNGFKSDIYSEGVGHLNARYYADWSATAFNLDLLTLTPHSTTLLSYISWVEVSNADDCLVLSTCTGVQVAFGDPRKSGTSNRSAFGFAATDSEPEPYIGRAFDPYESPTLFVTPATEPLASPEPLPEVTYGSRLIALVPEPASWAMLLLGFGVIGSVLRRRPSAAAAIA